MKDAFRSVVLRGLLAFLMPASGAVWAQNGAIPIEAPPRDVKPFDVCPLEMRKIARFEQSEDLPKKLFVRYEDGEVKHVFTASPKAKMIWGNFEDYIPENRWILVRERDENRELGSHVFYLPALREIKPDNFGYNEHQLKILGVDYVQPLNGKDKIDVLSVRIKGKDRQYALFDLEPLLNKACSFVDGRR